MPDSHVRIALPRPQEDLRTSRDADAALHSVRGDAREGVRDNPSKIVWPTI